MRQQVKKPLSQWLLDFRPGFLVSMATIQRQFPTFSQSSISGAMTDLVKTGLVSRTKVAGVWEVQSLHAEPPEVWPDMRPEEPQPQVQEDGYPPLKEPLEEGPEWHYVGLDRYGATVLEDRSGTFYRVLKAE